MIPTEKEATVYDEDKKCYIEAQLFRIRATKDFSNVKAGDFGGLIQDESNLSQEGDCSKYSKNKLSLEYLNESTYNKLIRTQMENTKNITGVPAHTIVLIVFLIIFAYTIYAILYLTQMKA